MTRNNKLVATLALVAVSGVLASVFLPTLVDEEGEHSVAISLKSALSAFRQNHGRNPARFTELEPLLEEITRWECNITEANADRYEIEMFGKYKKYYVDLEYKADEQGKMERYHVVDIRSSPLGKRL